MRPSELLKYGQSPWLDYMRRHLLTDGELARLRDEGVRGVTSNPSIFEKAFAGSSDYDEVLRSLQDERSPSADVYETLVVEDIQGAADVLRPVYDESNRADGFASLEVSPRLAHDTDGTLQEARRLWKRLDRDNVMIKVPATKEGIPAIRQLLSEGINVTLMFAKSAYDQVVDAYLSGLEEYRDQGGDLGALASVASIFVSRFDVMVDPMLEEKAKDASGQKRKEILDLVGKVGIANATRIYRSFREACDGGRFRELAEEGARPQRILFASTSTKDPRFSDVMYVEALIGRDTVDTVPPATLDALRDHGTARAFAYLRHEGEADDAQDRKVKALAEAGQPVVELALTDIYDLPQEFFRWEIATAVAGAILDLDPFDQPDVEASKEQARKLTDEYEKTGEMRPETYFFEQGPIGLFADERNRARLDEAVGSERSLGAYYLGLLAWVVRRQEHEEALQAIRLLVRDRTRAATCVGFGPRFLHSTGQAYKGGPPSGVFVHLVGDDPRDLPVPGHRYSFGVVKQAQARGDFRVLSQRNRRLLGVHLGADTEAGFQAVLKALREVL
jgi:transaldolase